MQNPVQSVIAYTNYCNSIVLFSRCLFCLCRFTQSNKRIRGWYQRAPSISHIMSQLPPKKVADLAGLRTYVSSLLPHLGVLLDFHMHKPFRDLRFRRYVMSKKKFSSICKSFLKKSDGACLIGVGDCGATSNSSVIRGGPRAPVKRLARELNAHPDITAPYVDEANSSRLCSYCHDELSHMRRKSYNALGHVVSNSSVYEVFHCCNSECLNTTVHRDVDAANSILEIFLHLIRWGVRPDAYAYRRLVL